MGCLKGDTRVKICEMGMKTIHPTLMTFEHLWNQFENNWRYENVPRRKTGHSYWYDTTDTDLKIYDANAGKCVQVKKVIKNENVKNWIRLTIIRDDDMEPMQIYQELLGR